MFYSDKLLSKTGPLARVWLAANLERKLSKSNILQSNIESHVNTIVESGQAPMALRLSGQLLLGVVRIYSRKARYLLDDCNEALMKIKLAFRPGNVDLPANQVQAVNPASLTLPDVLTEMDLLAPMPDPSLLLSQEPEIEIGRRDPTLLDPPSQYLLDTQDRQAQETLQLGDDDLYLDISEGPDITMDKSIEVGRDAPPPRALEDEMASTPKPLEDDGIELDFGDEPDVTATDLGRRLSLGNDDVAMGGMDDELPRSEHGQYQEGPRPEQETSRAQTPVEDEPAPDAQEEESRGRDSASPLSSARSSVARELEETFHFDQEPTVVEPEEEVVTHAQRNKRRKVISADAETELSNSQFKALQNDRSQILKPASFLPRDPALLALMNLQKSGGFVSSILGDGRSQGWAPELRGILSLEVVRRSRHLKRKRDEPAAHAEEVDGDVPQLEIPDESAIDFTVGPVDVGGDTTLDMQQEGRAEDPDRAASVEPLREDEEEEEEAMSPLPGDNFDETTMPLLHPADSGPVSVGTQHAVHLLREKFGAEAENSPNKRQQRSVLFQDMLPERSTTRADATKMFFECLVLATKDAIKVEQKTDELGAPIRVRAKRGLWGDWAEMSAGGEIASQAQTTEEGQAGAAGPSTGARGIAAAMGL